MLYTHIYVLIHKVTVHACTRMHTHTFMHTLTHTPHISTGGLLMLSPLPRLKAQAKDAIEALGSKEIKNMKFRSSWVFVAAKGFELPSEIEREKVSDFS